MYLYGDISKKWTLVESDLSRHDEICMSRDNSFYFKLNSGLGWFEKKGVDLPVTKLKPKTVNITSYSSMTHWKDF